MEIRVGLPRLRLALGWTIVLLAVAGICAEAMRYHHGSDSWLVGLFSLSEEANLPTWFSAIMLFSCSIVLGAIARLKKAETGARFGGHWAGLAAIFCYMSIDELCQIHEHLNDLKSLHGLLYFTWVIPAGLVVALFALAYLPFLLHLPGRTRLRVALAGLIYVGGALGVELVLGRWSSAHGEENFGYALIDMVEETMEMAGAALFLTTLLEYLGELAPDLRVSIGTGRTPGA